MANISKILPACGFAIGVALVAVTSAFKEAPKTKSGQTMLTFQYVPPAGDPNPYSAANVADVSNWSFTSDASRCDDEADEACKIYVPDNSTYVGADNTLKSAIDIVAGGSTDEAYVAHTAAGSGSAYVSNKSDL